MDKKMINIDELVRQRLSGEEEQEHNGAWLQMRQLLDKQMPIQKRPFGGYGWRRMFTAVTGIVLLVSLTVGGYRSFFTDQLRQVPDSGQAASFSPQKANIPSYKEDAGTIPSLQDPAGTKETRTTFSSSANGTRQNTAPVLSPRNTTSFGPLLASTDPSVGISTGSSNPFSDASAMTGTERHTTLQTKETLLSLNPGKKPDILAVSDAAVSHNNIHPAVLPVTQPPLQPAGDQSARNTDSPQGNSSREPEQQTALPVLQAASSSNPDKETGKASPADPFLLKDSIKKLTIRRRFVKNPVTNSGVFVLDTISMEYMMLPAPEPVMTGKATANNTVAVSESGKPADAASYAADHSQMIPLSSLKVGVKKTGAWNTRSFNEVMRDVKFSLAKIRFYPGVILGFNSQVAGQNNPLGIHLGVTGTLTFGEQWSMVAEFRYLQRMNNGAMMYDNYSVITGSSQTSTGETVYHRKDYEHFFKFSTLHSLELPFMVKYSTGRVNFFGGALLSYHFQINTEEVNRSFDSVTLVSIPTGNNPSLDLNDFGSRFGLGYSAGIGYQLSPAVQFDFRISQNIWDNRMNTGTGAYKISRQWYQKPYFQISIGYRFSQKNRIPRAR